MFSLVLRYIIILHTMNPEQQGEQQPSIASTLFTMDSTTLPLDIILYLAHSMTFEDYRNFIRALWPNNDECQSIREKLWQLSCHRIKVRFINGSEVDIVYNYDPERQEKKRILLNFASLLPIYGPLYFPEINDFAPLSRVDNFIHMHCHLDMCSDDRYASCLCHRIRNRRRLNLGGEIQAAPSSGDQCGGGHSHHYCSLHVSFWLNYYVMPLIRQQITKTEIYNEIEASKFLHYLRNTICLRGMGLPDPFHPNVI